MNRRWLKPYFLIVASRVALCEFMNAAVVDCRALCDGGSTMGSTIRNAFRRTALRFCRVSFSITYRFCGFRHFVDSRENKRVGS